MQSECHKVFAFPSRNEARRMLRYARPDAAGRQFNDAYHCRIPGCNQWHLTTKIGAPVRGRARPRSDEYKERNT